MKSLLPAARAFALTLSLASALAPRISAQTELLNASHDLSGEFYAEFNPAFEAYYQNKTGQAVSVGQSHGASGKQARAVLDGLEADVVTFSQEGDLQLLVDAGWIHKNWKARLPYGGSPYRTLTVFVVHKGNPKKIKTWEDLAKKGVKLVAANPRTSGNGRYTFIGAAANAQRHYKGNEDRTKTFLKRLYANAATLLPGGRDLTDAFVERKSGDVLITFEAEARRLLEQFPGQYEFVIPRLTVSPDFPVAVVDKVVNAKGSRGAAEAYADYLFSDAGQEIAAKHHYRVNSPKIASRYAAQFPAAEIVDILAFYGSWNDLNRKFFADGGWFDQVTGKP